VKFKGAIIHGQTVAIYLRYNVAFHRRKRIPMYFGPGFASSFCPLSSNLVFAVTRVRVAAELVSQSHIINEADAYISKTCLP